MTVAMDAMAVAIHIKYALSLNRHLITYLFAPEVFRSIAVIRLVRFFSRWCASVREYRIHDRIELNRDVHKTLTLNTQCSV